MQKEGSEKIKELASQLKLEQEKVVVAKSESVAHKK